MEIYVNPQQMTLSTKDLSRSFRSYIKPEGLKASLSGLFNRQYKEVHALLPTNIEIFRGEVVGLVGANGAGKTTLLKILSGLIVPSSGEARVLGFNPAERKHEYLRKMSILLGQKNQLWWDLPAVDSFALLGNIYGIEKQTVTQRMNELAEVLDCKHVLEIQLRRLSLGERMKMEMIGALLHRQEIIFLDEPTIGLDILAQKKIRGFLQDYVKQYQPTVILTSHYMDDIALLAKRLLLLSHGKIVYDGTVQDFVGRQENIMNVNISLSQPLIRECLINKTILPAHEKDFRFSCSTSDFNSLLPQILAQSQINHISTDAQDFEDVIHQFLQNESRVR